MSYTYLGKQNREEDLKKLDSAQCDRLCAEIRQELLERVTQNGGHLASNLGVVELTLAIHRVFSLPEDRLIFDVGHQSYVHKLLSDRFDRFSTLRQPGGLSGFQRRDESPYDPFGGGHASTSLSAAIGFAEADKLAGRSNYTICVVGDGAFTGGMIHEGLNNCRESLHLIIVLNENEMSISKNGGHFAGALLKMRTTGWYFNLKRRVKKVLSKTLFGQKVIRFSSRQKARIKRAIYDDNYFEQLGMNYLGPIDGHDRAKLELIFEEAKKSEGCTVVHVKTVKGKGYAPAEERPADYHGVSPFDPVTGKPLRTAKMDFSHVFGQELTALAGEDGRVCAITAAMQEGTGLTEFARKYPDRLFDVGIAEGHAVSMAGGMAKQGLVPVFAVYSSFLQRGYDQLLQDVALDGLHVVLGVDRAGLVGADGGFDALYLSQVPHMTVLCPASFAELRQMLRRAVLELTGPVAVRYPRGGEGAYQDCCGNETFTQVRPGADCTILTYGVLINEALAAAELLHEAGVETRVVKLNAIAPLDGNAVLAALGSEKRLLVLEDCVGSGCVGQRLTAILAQRGRMPERLILKNLGDTSADWMRQAWRPR